MISFKKPSSFKDLLIHLGLILGIVLLLIISVFYFYLPVTTNHGETITVPDVIGMDPEQLQEFLKKRSLRFEVTEDSSYSPNFPALAVLRQVPRPNTKVKENRKIYVTLNAERPPLVRMPKVIDLHLKSAHKVIKSYDLKIGEVRYEPGNYFGVVREARINNRPVLEGEKIEKGSQVDLVVDDGYGNVIFQSPNLIGLDQEEAEVVIIGSGLKVGNVKNSLTPQARVTLTDEDGTDYSEMIAVSPGSVQEQYPEPGVVLKIGDIIDLWIYKPDSINLNSTILDN
ncbi:MAG: PASTA domain-containing protein [Bacteroidota bacterium]